MKYKWFTAAFLSLCLIPAAGMLMLPEQQAARNVHLTPKPSLWNAQTGWNAEFLGDLTDYVADHFGFRQELVTANAALQTGLLCTSPLRTSFTVRTAGCTTRKRSMIIRITQR